MRVRRILVDVPTLDFPQICAARDFIKMLALVVLYVLLYVAFYVLQKRKALTNGTVLIGDEVVPISVNYHFTRICNYECGFCFHTAKTSYILPLEAAKVGLKMLKEAGMQKINFSGGEPFLAKKGNHVGEMAKYCKEELKLQSVTVVTNGSMVTENWFRKYGKYLDIMAVSCDSFNEDTNKTIGRAFSSFRLRGERNHIEQLRKIGNWCSEYDVLFKINTVVNTYNYFEDMTKEIEELNPVRWKVFQCLLLEGENVGEKALRNAEKFYISNELFQQFVDRHCSVKTLVPESNDNMQNSYLILDEYMRFLDCRDGGKVPSKSLLDVGVKNALRFSGFDEAMFKKRGGIYKWSKEADRFSW